MLKVIFKYKKATLTSKWFVVSNRKPQVILHGQYIKYVESKILENWVNIYMNEKHIGTIPVEMFRINFKKDIE